ncbi:hypothetical protein Q8A67_022862 [Cirrhinus molitorella]|nr:hypothetical protein Q8A67_022862 [Cirrhinus molitorella]
MESWETAVTYPLTSLFSAVQVKSSEQHMNLTGTVLLSEIMSVIARGNCGICNRRNVFATGNETLALSRKMTELKELNDETVCSYSLVPPEVTAESPTEKT